MRTWIIGAIVVAVSVFLIVAAVLMNPGQSPLACLLTRPDCSTAAFTYALVAFAALAFAAALDAGGWARKALDHERAPVLSFERCGAACKERSCGIGFLNDVSAGFDDKKATGSPESYDSYDFDVQNIGRTAIGDVVALFTYQAKTGSKHPLTFKIGPLAAGARQHGRLRITSALWNAGTFEVIAATGRLPSLGTPRSTRFWSRGKAKPVYLEFFATKPKLQPTVRNRYEENVARVEQAPPFPSNPFSR